MQLFNFIAFKFCETPYTNFSVALAAAEAAAFANYICEPQQFCNIRPRGKTILIIFPFLPIALRATLSTSIAAKQQQHHSQTHSHPQHHQHHRHHQQHRRPLFR